MSGLWEKIKAHPYLTAAIVVGIFILVYMLVGGGGTQQASGGQDNYAAEVAAATQLQNAQLQAQVQTAGINAGLTAQQGQVQAATTIAQLEAQTSQQNIQAQQTVAQQQITAQQESQDLQTSTYGQIASNQIAAQQTVALAGFSTENSMNTTNNQTAQTVYSSYFDTLKAMAGIQANVQTYGIAQNAFIDQLMIAGPSSAQAAGQILPLYSNPSSSNFNFGMVGGSSLPGQIAQMQLNNNPPINPNTGLYLNPSLNQNLGPNIISDFGWSAPRGA